MTGPMHPDPVTPWVSELLDGELSGPQERDLLAALREDERMARRVVHLIQDDCILQALLATSDPRAFIERVLLNARYIDTGDSFADRVTCSVFTAEEMESLPPEDRQRIEQIRINAERQLDAFLALQREESGKRRIPEAGWDVSGAVATATETMGRFVRTGLRVARVTVVCSLVWAMVLIFLYVRAHQSVATLADSMDARWNTDIQENTALSRGPYRLEQGYARIVFQRGAGIWIEAPAEFSLSSTNEMILQSGRLFAEVPPSAKGFEVRTPHTRVVDLGTQFGIRVEQDGSSDLYLFKGKAALTSNSENRTGGVLTVTAGHAKRVDSKGQVKDIPLQEEGFTRQFYPNTRFVWRGQRLSLTDLIGKGNGLGTVRTDVSLDPIEGYKESLYCDGKGNEYHRLSGNPFIDGLFIPDGRQRQIISSQGHVFIDCPRTNGECYAALAANPSQGLYGEGANNLTLRVVDPSAQGTPAFVLADETYVVTGTETGAGLMPENWSENGLGTGTWVHFKLGRPVHLAANRQYGFDVTVSCANRGYCFETAGVVKDSYAGGAAYSTGTKGGTYSLHLDEVYEGDHTFVAELAKIGEIEPALNSPKVTYSATAPDVGPDDVMFLGESTIDNKNVGGFPGQTYSGDNDHATYMARDRRGLGQTFTTGSHPGGYTLTGFWLKHVRYADNLSGGNGTWWYIGAAQRRNGIIRFNGQDYGSGEHPCIVMHANLGITFDLRAIRALCPGLPMTRFVSQFGIADLEEQVGGHADFWVLVDGQVRDSGRNVTQKNVLSPLSIELSPSDRFLTLVTTDGGDIDRRGAYQRSYTGDWCVFTGPALILETSDVNEPF